MILVLQVTHCAISCKIIGICLRYALLEGIAFAMQFKGAFQWAFHCNSGLHLALVLRSIIYTL